MRPAAQALFASAGLAVTLSLSGCAITDALSGIGGLEGTSVQDAIDSATSALDEANQALAGAAGSIDESLGGLADALGGASDVPGLLSELFGERDLAGSSSRVESVDLGGGDVLATLDSASELASVGDVLSGLNVGSWKLVSHVPGDAVADRALRFYTVSAETLSGGGGDEAESMRITMYDGEPYIDMHIVPLGLTLSFEVPQQDADALRGLL